jgi:hypothetical protein
VGSFTWRDLVGDVADVFSSHRPGDWESGETSARLGEKLLARLAPPKFTEEAPVSMLSQFGPYAGGYEFPGGGGGGGGMLPSGEEEGVVYEGGFRHRHRRQNPLNIRAARRAISRIKAVMKLLHRIESHLPRPRMRRGLPMHHTRYAFYRRRR